MSRTALVVRRVLSGLNTYIPIKKLANNHLGLGSVRYFSVNQSRNMKFVQFVYKDNPEDIRVGYVEGDNVVDINKADVSLPTTLLGILKNGDVDKVKKLASSKPASVPLSTVTLKAPIHGVDKVLCIGLNYKDHCSEQNLQPPEVPVIFNKFPSTIIGPSDALKLRSNITDKVDWEVELCVVIGKKASHVKAEDALDYLLGCTIAQDISARDWQKSKNGGQFLLGKAMDTFCPIGPWVVTLDEVGNPETLDIKCSVNGVEKQNSNTNQFVHKLPAVIERLTSVMTLLPGDMLLTGTPGGVGMHRSPPEYLRSGDVITSEIQHLGVLETRVEDL